MTMNLDKQIHHLQPGSERTIRLKKFSEPEHGELPLLKGAGLQIEIDDAAHFVLVFPRTTDDESKSCLSGDTVDPAKQIQDPRAAAERIFVRPTNPDSKEVIEHMTKEFTDLIGTAEEPATACSFGEYAFAIKKVLLTLMQTSGFVGGSFDSVDGDEVFLKLYLPRDGWLGAILAERYGYVIPFNEDTYKNTPPLGEFYSGGEAPKNSYGERAYAYSQYSVELAERYQPLRDLDLIRICHRRLERWVNLDELVAQGIIKRWFPAGNYDTVMKLSEEWANLKNMFCLPKHTDQDQARDYFGEEVAFYFTTYSFFLKTLIPLAIIGIIAAGRRFLPITYTTRDYIKVGFTLCLTIWATIFMEFFTQNIKRNSQKWGMEHYEKIAADLSTYRKDLEGTMQLKMRIICANACTFIFICLFMGAIFSIKYFELPGPLGKALLTTVVMQVGKFIWVKLTPILVNLQNPRTRPARADLFANVLGFVKIFITLWPFFAIAFVNKWTEDICADTLAEAANMTYAVIGKPSGLETIPGLSDNGTGWDFLDNHKFRYHASNGQECVYGCYPVDCHPTHCVTNCEENLVSTLAVYYFSGTASTFAFILIPMFLVRREVTREIKSERSSQSESDSSETEAEAGKYSFLQFQAKCSDLTPYEFNSWGGSMEDDMMQLVINFALLTCFGIALPILSAFAVFCGLIEYRLVAFRMTNVTSRPIPAGAEGIGVWYNLLSGASYCAVIVNCAFAVSLFPEWSPLHQVVGFLVLEHTLLGAKFLISDLIPDTPNDVKLISEINTVHVAQKQGYQLLGMKSDHLSDYSDVDIGQEPGENRGHKPGENYLEAPRKRH